VIGFLSALASFLFLFLSGYPIACLLLRDGRRRLRLVLAPLLGACLDAVLLYVLGYNAGLPTRTSSVILLAAVVALNLFAAVRDRDYFRFSGAETGPLAAGLLYLVILAVPLFIVGRGYMSIWNEDCYGYVAVADYLKDHTVRERIDPALVQEQPVFERVDTIVRIHFQDGFYRMGPEYQLSFISVLLGGKVRELFFPVLISFAMLMPLGLFLFLSVFGVPRRLALAAVFLLPMLSFHYFGFIAQMFAQAAGIPIVLLCFWALARAFGPARNRADLTLLSVALAGAILLYIEATALLFPAAVYAVLQWVRKKRRFARDARTGAVVLLVLVAFFNVKFPALVRYEVGQAHPERLLAPASGEAVGRPILFPYFLVETGLPTAWGLTTAPLSAWPFSGAPPAVLWIVMLLSAVLFAFWAFGILAFPYQKRALWGLVAGWFAAAAGLAFLARMDLLLYKLVIWHQFFLCAGLWVGIRAARATGKRPVLTRAIVGPALALLVFFNGVNIVILGRASLGESTVWVEWRGASRKDPLRGLEAARSCLSPGEPLTAIIPDFHPSRWASYVLKDHPVRFLVNNSRLHFRSRYEGTPVENGWTTRRLLLASAAEDIFENRVPARAIVRDAGYFRIADARSVSDYLFPVSTAAGIMRQANPEIKAVVGWYPYEIYPESPWFFDRRGFRWIENNSAFLIKNVSGRPLRLKISLEVAPGVGPLPMRVEFEGRTIWTAELTGLDRILSEPFTPIRDGLGRIVFAGAGTRIDPGRPLRLINRDIGSDDRVVNARIGRLEAVPEAEAERSGFFFGGGRFGPADLDKDNVYFSGLYPDGWASPSVGFVMDLADKRAFRFRILVPALNSPDGFVLSVRIDGKPAGRLPIRDPGPAVLEVPIPPESRRVARIEIKADRAWPISARDRRHAAYLFQEGELLGRLP
jgi:hypothetical protein